MARKKNFKDISFVLTDEDQIEFNKYYIHNSASGKRQIWFQKLLVPFMTVCFFIFMSMGHVNNKILYIGGAILIFLSYTMWGKAEETVINQQLKSIEGPNGYDGDRESRENRMQFEDDGFTMTFKGEAHKFDYDVIKKVEITENGLYIWTASKMVFPIPKRAFNRETEMEELFEYLQEHCQ